MLDQIFRYLPKQKSLIAITMIIAVQFGFSATFLRADTIFTTTDLNQKIIFCRHFSENNIVEPGQMKRNSRFISHTEQQRLLRRKLRKLLAVGARADNKVSKLKSKIRKFKSRAKSEKVICDTAFGELPENTPSPSPSPSSPPPDNTEPCTGSFDANGNTCPNVFGIPHGLSGNITRGRQIQELRCTGCHMERTAYQYSPVQTAINNVPDMHGVLDGYQLEQAIADLVAYFNRFN